MKRLPMFAVCALVLMSPASAARAPAQSATERDLLDGLRQPQNAFLASLNLAAYYRAQGRPEDAIRMLNMAIALVRDEARPPNASIVRPFAMPDGPVRVGGDVSMPRKIKHVEPAYPASARASGLAGAVIVEFTIEKTGAVRDVRVLGPFPPFDAAAVEAVKQWRYEPVVLNGERVEIIMTARLDFKP